MRIPKSTSFLLHIGLALVFGLATVSDAADHLDAPLLEGNGQVDINDLYAFQSPENPDHSVLIMTVNPFAGIASPTDFGTDVDYEFKIDNNGDAVADLTYRATFTGNGLDQTVSLLRDETLLATGEVGDSVEVANGGKFTTGVFDDPFFFDLAGFNDGFAFTGDDTLAGANVSAIILEVPSATLGDPSIGVWARTVRGGVQEDRIGRPAINTALIGSSRKNDFNRGRPADDRVDFGDEVNTAIASLSNQANADALTPILLPDVLTFDTSSSDGFLNGRQLADDVIDAELGLLTEGALASDGVDGNDVAFSPAFPYLGEAHVVPEPSSTLSLWLAFLTATALFSRRR